MNFTVVYNLIDPNDPQGRSYKEINLEQQHSWPRGTLVEIDYEDSDNNGVRMFVALCGRDCDGTPLYWLTHDLAEIGKTSPWYERHAAFRHWHGGYSEDSLNLISLPDEARLKKITDWEDYYAKLGE